METRLISTLSMPEMTDLIEKSFVTVGKYEPMAAEQFYMRESIPAGTGSSRRYDEFDMDTFGRNKREGADAKKGDVAIGYNKTMTMKRIALEIDITWEMRNNGKNQEIINKIKNLTAMCPNRKELDLTHQLFTFATSSSYTDMDGETVDVTGGDSLAPAYSAHTLKYSSTTWRNRIANDPIFSTGALEAGELLAATNIYDNFGRTRNMMFNVIFCGKDPSTNRLIRRVIDSGTDVDYDNPSVINTYSEYRKVTLPYLATDANGAYDSTKRRWWGMAAAGEIQAHYGVWEESNLKTPMPGNNGEDFHNDNWTYGTRMAYGKCLVTAKGLIYSCPTS